MARTGEAAQIRADLGEHDFGRPPADAWDRLQPLQFSLKRAQPRSNLGAHSLQTGIEEVNVGELLGNQELLMRAELAGQRLLQLGDLLAQPPTGQLGELGERRRIGGSRDQRRQEVAAGLAQDIGRHRRQLASGSFEDLLQAVHLVGALVDQGGAVAGQLAELTLGTIRNEARPQQAVAQEIRDPFGVANIGLASRHRLNMRRVDH
jgi:hypothetical protein